MPMRAGKQFGINVGSGLFFGGIRRFAAVIAASCALSSAPVVGVQDDETLVPERFVVGRISQKTSSTTKKIKALNRYLSQALPAGQKIRFEARVVPTVAEMALLLRKGEVDLVSETPFSALELERLSGADIVLHEWKKGVAEYSTVLVARRADKIASLEGLRGKTIAFEDPGSTSGFLMPLALLRSSGLDVVELQSIASKPGSNQVGYIFGEDELNVTSLVEQGAVAAGALSNLDWYDEDEVPDRMKRSLEVFYESAPILRSVVLVRGDMQSELKSQIIKVFLEMHDSPEGWQAMKKYNKVRRFAPVTPAVQSSLDRLRPMYQSVRDKIR